MKSLFRRLNWPITLARSSVSSPPDSVSPSSLVSSPTPLHGQADTISPALIFIPDINGFTHFVTQTPILHSKDIIGELLETVMNNNQLDLEISEIEGDAILFYRFGPAPSMDELTSQITQIVGAFEQTLRAYERTRLCGCQACEISHQLAIKFIVHYGPVTSMVVGDFAKLLGPAVIVVHRLLKNEVNQEQYALLSEDYLSTQPEGQALLTRGNDPWQLGETAYEHIGPVRYCYETLPFSNRKETASPPEIQREGTRQLISLPISTPMDWVYHVLIDPNLASAHGTIRNQLRDPRKVLRCGSWHTLVSPTAELDLRTGSAQVEADRIVYADDIPSISPHAQAIFEVDARGDSCELRVVVDAGASEVHQDLLATYAKQIKLVSEREYRAEDWAAGVF